MLPELRPSISYKNLMNVARFCGRLIGVDVIVPNYHMNDITYIVVVFIILYYTFSTCTVLKYLSEDWAVILEVICTMGSATAGLVKFITVIYYAKEYSKLHEKLLEIYCKYENMGTRYEAALYKSSKRLRTILHFVGILYAATITLIISVPIIMMCTQYGYWFTFIFHLFGLFIAAFGLYASEMYLLIFLTHALLFVDILRLKVEDLNLAMSEERELNKGLSEEVNDILQWHQTYFEFAGICNNIFYWIVSAQIFGSSISIVLTLFIIRTRDWPAAIVYLLFSLNTLYEYCILGTGMEICNDHFCEEIYKIHWYNMSTSEQKSIRLMLMRSQISTVIDIAGIMPLTVATGLAITRSIYSIFMIMLQFY